ncbi:MULTISPECIES: hypothetical protein [unclassified Paenibacillus]|uniref:hypothetical protein n=1 Tax=unclassified Paenibacillus TaxID=185978 RepID=UPI0030F94FBA
MFEKTLSKLPGYSPENAPLEVWLFAIARNVVNDYYRSRARQRFFSLDSIFTPMPNTCLRALPLTMGSSIRMRRA